jgi:hypothetical protein
MKMRTFIYAFALALGILFVSASYAGAQTPNDRWATAKECLAADGAPFYVPPYTPPQKLAKNEVIWGHPTGGCLEKDLHDGKGGRGFVRIEPGRELVHNRTSGQILRLANCNGQVYSFVPFPPVERTPGVAGATGPAGPQGSRGARGSKGDKGEAGKDGKPGRDGFCSSMKCKLGIAAVVGTGVAFATYYATHQRSDDSVAVAVAGIVIKIGG